MSTPDNEAVMSVKQENGSPAVTLGIALVAQHLACGDTLIALFRYLSPRVHRLHQRRGVPKERAMPEVRAQTHERLSQLVSPLAIRTAAPERIDLSSP